jgi:peptidoglycan hydrolase-like protein with peptidoglycan-binding domain
MTRKASAVAAGVTVLLVGGVAAAGYGFGGDRAQPPASTNLPPATTAVTRTTLTQTVRVDGVLGYGAPLTVSARAGLAGSVAVATAGAQPAAAAPGQPAAAGAKPAAAAPAQPAPTANTLTWLPGVGGVVRPGQPMFKVDERPVVLMAGSIPLFRILAVGVTGADVKMLEANLKSFGYTGFTVDTRYTAATAAAVKRWQRDLGLPPTGTVDVNQVVTAPGALRVAEHKAEVGAEAGGPVLTCTGTTRLVTVPLEVTRQQLVRVGLPASVSLPDGKTVRGVVASIGTVAAADGTGQEPGQQRGPPTVQVVVTIADQAALGALDQAPVQLALVAAERKDVLTVPVGALLALAEGGYGVQVVEGATTRYVPVTTGMFADGRVEISGDEIREGMTVGVPT